MKNMVTLAKNIRKKMLPGETIAFISGYFNILHPGHLRLIQFASEQADHLVVSVLSDKMVPDATVRDKERLEAVTAIRGVGTAFILDADLGLFIEDLKPDVVIKGWEYKDSYNLEKDVVSSYGGVLIFSSGDTKFSSFDLITREFRNINYSNIEKPKNFPSRHNFNHHDVQDLLKKFTNLNVCVIGDVIVDEYLQCDAIGMSREDPTIVVRPIQSTCFLGGAGIVAAHAAKLGAQVNFLSVVGNDEHGSLAQEKLDEYGIASYLISDSQRPTTHKLRYRAEGKTMLRVNNFTDQAIANSQQEEILSSFEEMLPELDLLIFSDFNYGLLPQSLVDQMCDMANRKKVMIVADSQSSSQSGNIARFRNANLISPTEYEARLALQNFDDGLVVLAEKLCQQVHADHVFITLGREGILIHSKQSEESLEGKWVTDRLPALNSAPKDAAGAGDALLVVSSMALACQGSVWESSYLGVIAAACQVGRVGNIPLVVEELLMELVD